MRSAATAFFLSAFAVSLHAQNAPVLPRSTYELERRERWILGEQNPLHVPFQESRPSFLIASAEPAADGGRVWQILMADTLTFRVDRFGQVQSIVLGERLPRPPSRPGFDAARMRYLPMGALALPESRAWELTRTFRPAQLRAGARWTEPIRLHDTRLDMVQSVTGSRVATLLRDTIIEGRPHWIVRDSARLTWVNEWPESERTTTGDSRVRQSVTGLRRGLLVYDPEYQLLRLRADTIMASGSVLRTRPDGSVVRTPARFEQYTKLTWRDSVAARLWREQLLAQRRATDDFRIVDVPNERQRQLREGDAHTTDSMIVAWHGASDPNTRTRVLNELLRYARPDSLLRRRIRQLALQAGDTATAFDMVAQWSYNSPLGVQEIQFLLPFLAEPARAVRLARGVDGVYERFLDEAMQNTGNPQHWGCARAACELLAEQVEADGDDRLRQLAWSMRVLLDPKRWYDALEAQVQADSLRPLLLKTYKFANGEPNTVRRSRSIPSPTEDWRAWLHWIGAPGRDGVLGGGFLGSDLNSALAFVGQRTGRDFSAELTAAYGAAREDSAKLVLGVLAHAFGYQPSAEEVERHLDAGKPLLRELARSQLWSILRSATPADITTQEEVVRQLLAWRFDKGPPWLTETGETERVPWQTSVLDSTTFLLADSLPPGQRAHWAARGHVITKPEWDARSQHEKRDLYTISLVLSAGSFVSVNVNHAGYSASSPDVKPYLYYSGFSFILRRTSRGWVIVNSSAFIT